MERLVAALAEPERLPVPVAEPLGLRVTVRLAVMVALPLAPPLAEPLREVEPEVLGDGVEERLAAALRETE